MNTIKLAHGYQRGGIDWWSEAKTPSRLGDENCTVMLARWDGATLRPWVDGPHGWDYSSVRVAARLVSEVDRPTDSLLAQALDNTLAALPGQGRWCVLLPMMPTPQGWVGHAMSAPSRHQAALRLAWIYDENKGLRRFDEGSAGTDMEDPEA